MRVLQVIDKLNIGGAEKVFIDLSNLLVETGRVELEVCILEGEGELDSGLNPDIQKHYLRRNEIGILKSGIKLRELCSQFDIIHTHMRHVFKFTSLVNLGSNANVILHDHFGSIEVDEKISFWLKYILAPKYYIGVSDPLVEWAKSHLGRKTKNHLLENIIIPLSIEKVNKKTNNKIVLVGNIKPIKNQIFALELILELGYFIDFYGEIQDQNYYKVLQSFIIENKLENKVKFITDVKNVQPFLSKYSLGLSCSKSESGPLVLLEYLCQGLPVVSFATGAVSDRLKNLNPTFFCHNFDHELWIQNILNNQGYSSDYCKKIFSTHYNSKDYINKCLKIYSEILS